LLAGLRLAARVDVSPVDPYSRYAREQAVRSALNERHITFEEYVAALDERSNVPKRKFEEILKRRSEALELQAAAKRLTDQMEEGEER
ncbi:MAG: hypothetical protein IJ044_00485, partial [Oscillospiraceae bacterium]|nr:hypothetical protein [Oscillospiraceae bacterium]